MNEPVRTIQAELMLLNWQVTATGGAKVVFAINEDDLEAFKLLTLKDGKRPGQRMMAVLALLDEATPPPVPRRRPLGPLCALALRWCDSIAFQAWVAVHWPTLYNAKPEYNLREVSERAAYVIKTVCAIDSRKHLDTNIAAADIFNVQFRQPYMQHLSRHDKERPNGNG